MATIVEEPTTGPDRINVDMPIIKVEDGDDGSVYVYGRATDETLDHDEQIVDSTWASEAIPKWLATGGNVRVMHSPNLYPAGRGVEYVKSDDGGHYVRSKIVEPTAVRLLKEGVLSCYSVGIARPKIVRDAGARNGRINGGDLVELSVVDRGSNPSCGLMLVKMAKDGEQEFCADFFVSDEARDLLVKHIEAEMTKAAPPAGDDDGDKDPTDCPTCDGDGKIMDGNRKCPDCGGSGKFADMADDKKADFRKKKTVEAEIDKRYAIDEAGYLAKKDMAPNVGGGVDRDKLKASDFVFGDERTFPVVKPGDVSDAVSSWGRYKGDHSFDDFKTALTALAKRKGDAFVAELPTAWSDSKKADMPDVATLDLTGQTEPTIAPVEAGVGAPAVTEKTDGGIPFGLRRLHDVLCPCYPWEAIKDAYPNLAKNGVAGALGGPAVGMLFQMLSHEVEEDAGTGSEADDIACLAKSYGELVRFLNNEAMDAMLGPATQVAMAAARLDLHKSFSAANDGMPTLHPLNTGGSPVNPADYHKPYIGGGHAKPEADGAGSASVKPATVVTASSFDRDLITAGHQAPSPETSTRTPFNADASPSTHSVDPDLTKDAAARTFYTNAGKDRAKNVMTLMHAHIAEQFPDVCPMTGMQTAEGGEEKADTDDTVADPLDTRAGEGLQLAASPPKGAGVDGLLTKVLGDDMATTVTKAMDDRLAAFRAESDAKVEKVVAERDDLTTKLEALATEHQALIDAIGSQPDPRLDPIRGNGAVSAFAARLAEKAAGVAPVVEDPAVVEKRAKMAEYQAWLRSGDPTQRILAESELRKLT